MRLYVHFKCSTSRMHVVVCRLVITKATCQDASCGHLHKKNLTSWRLGPPGHLQCSPIRQNGPRIHAAPRIDAADSRRRRIRGGSKIEISAPDHPNRCLRVPGPYSGVNSPLSKVCVDTVAALLHVMRLASMCPPTIHHTRAMTE